MDYLRRVTPVYRRRRSGDGQLLLIAPILILSLLALLARGVDSHVDADLDRDAILAKIEKRLRVTHVPENHVSVPSDKGLPAVAVDTELRRKVHFIKRNESLATILKQEGLSRADMAGWLAEANRIDVLRRLQVGHAMTLSYELLGGGAPELRTVSYDINKRLLLVLEKRNEGTVDSRVETVPTTLVWRAVGGRIQDSLYEAATNLGVPAGVVDDLADMDWELDLSSQIRRGALFKIIFEEMQSEGKTLGFGRVLAAEIKNNGKTYRTFSIGARDDGSYLSGEKRLKFLRYPVRFTRISSVFTDARFHPIYKQRRPHLGVDFAAPTGTPVRAVAAGKVSYAGWKGAYGRFIRINHAGPYSSAYAHLRRIKSRVKVGTKVKRGEIIGHVGASGAATGPHLHFEMHKNGKYVNPLKIKFRNDKNDDSEGFPKDVEEHKYLLVLKKKLEEYLAELNVEKQPDNRIYVAVPPVERGPKRNG